MQEFRPTVFCSIIIFMYAKDKVNVEACCTGFFWVPFYFLISPVQICLTSDKEQSLSPVHTKFMINQVKQVNINPTNQPNQFLYCIDTLVDSGM